MPESFNDRAIVPAGPAKLGGAQGATNAEPSTRGVAGGGTDSPRVTRQNFEAGSTRPEVSTLKPPRAPAHFADHTT